MFDIPELKRELRERGIKATLTDLLALAPKNDPSGKIEWCAAWVEPDVDVQLYQIALTQDQCNEFRLPRIPIKSSDAGKCNFERRHGCGAVELDALEVLHPGELVQIVSDAFELLYDHKIGEELYRFKSKLRDEIYDRVHDTIIDQAGSEIDNLFVEIRADTEEMVDKIKVWTETSGRDRFTCRD